MDQKHLQKLLKALSGGPRLTILAFLKRNRGGTVSDVARAIDRSVVAASLHLSHLERVGILVRRQRGKAVVYRLSLAQVPIVRDVLKLL